MASYIFDKVMTGEEIKSIIQKDLGSAFRVEVKKNRIEIVQDASKGCLFQFQEKDGSTVCVGPYGSMLSFRLRAAIVFGVCALSLLAFFLSRGSLVVGIGAIPMIFAPLLLIEAPSQILVKKVAGILEKVASKA